MLGTEFKSFTRVLLTALQTLCLDFFFDIFVFMRASKHDVSSSLSQSEFWSFDIKLPSLLKAQVCERLPADVIFHRWFYLISVYGSREIHLKVYCVLKLSTLLKKMFFKLSQAGISYVFSEVDRTGYHLWEGLADFCCHLYKSFYHQCFNKRYSQESLGIALETPGSYLHFVWWDEKNSWRTSPVFTSENPYVIPMWLSVLVMFTRQESSHWHVQASGEAE